MHAEGVHPKKVVFIEGGLDDHYYYQLFRGLHWVYSKQVVLSTPKVRDSIPHLLNQQGLEQTSMRFKEYYRKDSDSNRDNNGSWLAVLDVDKFKPIEDTYGYVFADEMLIHFSNIECEKIRFSGFFSFSG